MTDEQVKKELADIALTTNWGSVERIDGVPTPIEVIKDALALINRLEEEKEQIRKETAKSIIDELKREFMLAIGTFNPQLAMELKTIYLRLEKEYGVEEVDNAEREEI